MDTTPTSSMKTTAVAAAVAAAVMTALTGCTGNTGTFQSETGFIFGTVYNVKYQHTESLKDDITRELQLFDGSLSMFNDTSTISRVNRNEDIQPDTLFTNVIRRSLEISQATDGCFDITVAPLVNAWGFGFKHDIEPDSTAIDSLMQMVGYDKIQLTPDGRVLKQDPRTMLDCSAIAKGYAVDIIASLLRRKGISNYMVDIGGEVDVAGHNPNGDLWHIGINKPQDDSLSVNSELQTVLAVSGVGIATSGNYRNFYYKGGRKFAHTIDPHTGYPVQHSILSATVIASDCMSADAYATSFMVMGLDKAREFLSRHSGIEAYLIYSGDDGKYEVYMSEGMKRHISE